MPLSLSNDMQSTNCTTHKPLFHNLYESYGSWTCLYALSISDDMQSTNCTTRKPLFHDLYELYGSWTCIYVLSISNDMQSTNCTTRKPLFHDLYESYELNRSCKKADAIIQVVSVRVYWTTLCTGLSVCFESSAACM